MSIVVHNAKKVDIKVAINSWGNGDGSYTTLVAETGFDHWDRGDDRGFVMVVLAEGTTTPYYVLAGEDIIISETQVTANKNPINPIKRH